MGSSIASVCGLFAAGGASSPAVLSSSIGFIGPKDVLDFGTGPIDSPFDWCLGNVIDGVKPMGGGGSELKICDGSGCCCC